MCASSIEGGYRQTTPFFSHIFQCVVVLCHSNGYDHVEFYKEMQYVHGITAQSCSLSSSLLHLYHCIMKYDSSEMLSAGTHTPTAAVRKASKLGKASNKGQPPRNDVPPAIVQTSSASASSVSVLEYSMPMNYVGKK